MIKKIVIRNFRNLSDVAVSFSPKVNILIGDNGQGKTNILEAIHVLMNGSSFRYADNENLLQKNTSEAFLKADCLQGEFDFLVDLKILKSRKTHQVNGRKVSLEFLHQKFPQVVFSPESLAAIKEGADQRRLLVDDLITSFSAKNAELIIEFRKALKTRNKVLRDCQGGEVTKNQTEQLLESLNPIYTRLAVELSWQRIQSLNLIKNELKNAMQYISNDRSVDISVEYVISSLNSLDFSREQIEKTSFKDCRNCMMQSFLQVCH